MCVTFFTIECLLRIHILFIHLHHWYHPHRLHFRPFVPRICDAHHSSRATQVLKDLELLKQAHSFRVCEYSFNMHFCFQLVV